LERMESVIAERARERGGVWGSERKRESWTERLEGENRGI
jgi:hypothetical protein